jgi:uncharacterized RDD family membrane protein YckC
MYCSRCGALNPEQGQFCVGCGLVLMRTPPAPALPYAAFGPRLLARIIDTLVLSPLMLLWVGLVVWALPTILDLVKKADAAGPGPNPELVQMLIQTLVPFIAGAICLVILTMVANWLYHALLESSERRGTVGKRMMGLAVTDIEGKRITFGRASVRWICMTLLTSQTMLIGYIMVAFTQKKQTLHDMLAETLVLTEKSDPLPVPPAGV